MKQYNAKVLMKLAPQSFAKLADLMFGAGGARRRPVFAKIIDEKSRFRREDYLGNSFTLDD